MILPALTMFYGWASPSVATSRFVCHGTGLTEPEHSSLWNLSDVSPLDKAGLNLAPRYVLPPGLSEKGTHSRTDDVMKQLAYLYDYDGRGRLVSKKLPGAAFAEYRYDPAGRIVAERDGRLAGDTWHLYVYDGCGRQVAKYRCGMMDDEITEFASVCRTASLTMAADEYDRGGYTLTPVSTAWPGDVVWA